MIAITPQLILLTKQRPDDHNPGVMVSDMQQPIRLPQSERLARMRLARSTNVGPVTFRKLVERFRSCLFYTSEAADHLPLLGVCVRPISLTTTPTTDYCRSDS